MVAEIAKPQQTEHYDRVTIAFHWLTALLVIVLFAMPLLWKFAPREWHLRWLEGVHVSLGIALAAVLIGRLLWRLVAGRRLAAAGDAVTGPLSRIVHAGLYALLAVQVGLGFAVRWLQGEEFSFFGLFSIPSLFASNRELAEELVDVHNLAGWALIVVAGGHAAAALYHQYVLKDRVLQRMLPSRG